jgi:hypothetical protein
MPNKLARGVPEIPSQIQFQDFSPDSDPITPGAILSMQNLYATAKGLRAYPSLSPYSVSALPGPCLGAFEGLLGETPVLVAGTATQLYLFDFSTRAWTPQGLNISPGVDRWNFDIYGQLLIAVNGVNPPFVYNGIGTFTVLGGFPPVASIVQATDYSVFLIPPDSADFWFSLSATIWAPSIATETVHGDLTSTHGNIKAAQKIRSGLALWKPGALHMGQFTQPPFYWEFRVISEQVGVGSQAAVAGLGDVAYFPGNDDFYSFDGYSLNRIPNNLKEWFFQNLDADFSDRIASRWDPIKNLVFWHFPSVNANPAGSLDMWIALNIRNGKWTANTSVANVQMPLFAPVPISRLTYGSFVSNYVTYGQIPVTTYGQLLQPRAQQSAAVIGTDGFLQTYSGTPGYSSITTHYFGDRLNMFCISRLRPEFAIYPKTGAVCAIDKQYVPGKTDSAPGGLASRLSSDGWFNLRSTARLQRFKMDFEDDFELVGLEADCDWAGDR